jgi:hypothetical protein
MPEISRFFGLIITMYWKDHSPPHFHVRYEKQKATFSIKTGTLLEGTMPNRAQRLILEWWQEHKHELETCWEFAENNKPLPKIQPLI